MTRPVRLTKIGAVTLAVALLVLQTVTVRAGGTPEDAALIIDPSRADALYIGNYYLHARNIPPTNVLYADPTATDYVEFAADNLDALFGTLANRNITAQIDYVVLAPASDYRIYAAGWVRDDCSPVNHFSVTAGYTLWHQVPYILNGNMTSWRKNRYFGEDNAPLAFDYNTIWQDGEPDPTGNGHQYFISAYLGYTGERGNSIEDITTMIDRCVAVDGIRPAGTFYYMHTTDSDRSGPRHDYYPAAVADITALGGSAELLYDVLPEGNHDCMGIMTGWASPAIDTADMTILPGAICDHLTSYAGHFDTSSQVKMSRWIANGAGGTWGAVEEPCNYAGKFPHARAHVYYYQGLSLGEALFRSVAYLPFQGLLYGDPLTRPYAFIPDVQVADAPTATVTGTLTITPTATTTHPTAQIELFQLMIDGLVRATIAPGEQFAFDTNLLSDGWHDLRVLAYDDTDQRFTGRWIGAMTTDNRGRSSTLAVTPATGNWTTTFQANLGATDADLEEIRLLHNGRVVAAADTATAQFDIHGLTFGAGPVTLLAEALYSNGERVHSEPVELEIEYAGDTPSGLPPVAFSYTKRVLPDQPFVVELPATFDDSATTLTYQLLSDPTQAMVVDSTGPYRLIRPEADASGADQFTFQVTSAAGSSNVATVNLVYWKCSGDLNGDGQISLADLAQLLGGYGMASGALYEDGDLDGDEDVDLSDLAELLGHYGDICF